MSHSQQIYLAAGLYKTRNAMHFLYHQCPSGISGPIPSQDTNTLLSHPRITAQAHIQNQIHAALIIIEGCLLCRGETCICLFFLLDVTNKQ